MVAGCLLGQPGGEGKGGAMLIFSLLKEDWQNPLVYLI